MINKPKIMTTIRFVFLMAGVKVDEFHIRNDLIRNILPYILRYFYISRQFVYIYWQVSNTENKMVIK